MLLLNVKDLLIKPHLPSSNTDTKQENANTALQSALIVHVLTDRPENITILNISSSSANTLVWSPLKKLKCHKEVLAAT